MLIQSLKYSNAFIILDDVDDVNQGNAHLPVQTHDFHSRSLILITSRDKQVLRGSKVENASIYTVTGLEIQNSWELFYAHAFNKPYPLPGFESLVDEFLKVCNGLPLYLKVFGELLYGRDIWLESWFGESSTNTSLGDT